MDLPLVAGWFVLGILFYFAVRPMYEQFQVNSDGLGMTWITGPLEFIYIQFAAGIVPQIVRLFGYDVFALTPFTCPKDHSDLADGLCYVPCKKGYHGVGALCQADSVNVGIGTPIGLEDCPAGWTNDGLTCREPLHGGGCNTYCDGNWSWSDGGFCHTHCQPITGGRVVGRLDHGGVCPGPGPSDHTDKVDSLCYAKCPKDMPHHIPGMPYLCYTGGELVYGRGAGKIPALFELFGSWYVGGT
jgi:hypothetical protein